MFTGIISEVACVQTISEKNSRRYVTVLMQQSEGVQLGDSVALNGICLTAKQKSGKTVTFEAVYETLQRTNLGSLVVGSFVNIELALRLSDRLGGHLVSGHIDGIGTIRQIENKPEQGFLAVELPETLTSFCLHKGSIAIDGVSLTLTSVSQNQITCAIIQHTLEQTHFQYRKLGDPVNVETDMIGKWMYHFLKGSPSKATPILDFSFLQEHGFA